MHPWQLPWFLPFAHLLPVHIAGAVMAGQRRMEELGQG